MDLLVNLTAINLTVGNYQSEKLHNESNNLFQSFNKFNDFQSVLTWMIRRMRGMMYLSNPYEVWFDS